MSISLRGLAILRPLHSSYLSRVLNLIPSQSSRTFSIGLPRRNTSLRFTNESYPFPLSPPSQIQAEPSELTKNPATFLEEESVEEYGYLETARADPEGAVVHSPAVQASEVILRLIARDEKDKAFAVRNEYIKHNIELAKNRAFADAAISELSLVDPGVRSKRFIAWWSLTPLEECPKKLAFACAKLMNHPFDIPLLMDFTIVCAKAGFVHEVEITRLFPHIIRYGHPEATTAFLIKLEHEARRHCGERESGWTGSESKWKPWMSMRNLAIRIHLLAGRKAIARELYEGAIANGFVIEEQTLSLLEANEDARPRRMEIVGASLLQNDSKSPRRSVSELAQELRLLRRTVVSPDSPPHFERFLANFIDAYEQLGRKSRAILMLREKVFRYATLAIRARWIAGEQLAYSRRRRSLAVLRTYMKYCLADHILSLEARRILKSWRGRCMSRTKLQRKISLDWGLSRRVVKVRWKIWPSTVSVSLAWKAVLQLAQKHDIIRLYTLFRQHVEAVQMTPKRLGSELASTNDLTLADKYYYDTSSHKIAIPPPMFPDPYYFHHFVVALATRCGPRYGAQVIRDMLHFGFAVPMQTWGTLAGAYARSGDLRRVLRIIDHLESGDVPVRGKSYYYERAIEDAEACLPIEEKKRTESLIATYNSVLRGLVEVGMYPEARFIHQRMEERGFIRKATMIKDRMDKRTRTALHRLARYEKGLHDRAAYRRFRKTVPVDNADRQLVMDKRRVDWLKEQEAFV